MTIQWMNQIYLILLPGVGAHFQVTHLLASEEVKEREFGSLERIHDNYPKYVISMDPVPSGRNGIRAANVVNWLLEQW